MISAFFHNFSTMQKYSRFEKKKCWMVQPIILKSRRPQPTTPAHVLYACPSNMWQLLSMGADDVSRRNDGAIRSRLGPADGLFLWAPVSHCEAWRSREIRNHQGAAVFLQLALKSELSQTKRAAAPHPQGIAATPHFALRSPSLPRGLRLQENKKVICS